MSSILTITVNPALDVNTRIDQVVVERKLRCEKPLKQPGGGGINVSRALLNLRGDSKALWFCGGHTGSLMHDLLDDIGIDQEAIDLPGVETRENFIVWESGSGQQYRFGMPGAELNESAISRLLERVERSDAAYVVASGSLPPGAPIDLYAQLGRVVPEGCQYLVDTSGEALKHCLGGRVTLLKPNVRELGELAGEEIGSDRQVHECSRRLIADHGLTAVLTSLGAGGALLVTADESLHVRSPTVKIKSKVGAGDSMVAGLLRKLSAGADLTTAARYAVAAGAAAVMTPATDLCRLEDTDRLFERILNNQDNDD